MTGIDDLPTLEDGLSPLQRRLLTALVQHAGTRRHPTIACNRLLEIVLGGRTPTLESKLAMNRPDELDPYLTAYLALVGLAQGFRTRYPLVEGLGNFGTIDGDPPADSMFTRCAPSRFGDAAVRGVVPTLLVNGAVPPGANGLSLPHRLGDVLAATARLIADPQMTDEALAAAIPGPDFPTGGVVVSQPSLHEMYATGRGELRLRACAAVAESGSRASIVVSELPFTVWKRDITRELDEQVRAGALTTIDTVSDRSDANGIRIVLALRTGAPPEHAFAELFEHTRLETTLRIEMAAIVDGHLQPVTVPMLLRAYVRQLGASLKRQGDEPTAARMFAELDALRTAHDDARRTSLV